MNPSCPPKYFVGDMLFAEYVTLGPERYDVWEDWKKLRKIAYVTLQQGVLTCTVPDVGGTVILKERLPNTEDSFGSKQGRRFWLRKIAAVIQKQQNKQLL